MNIKKISGTLAVVITMLGFNAAAQADCTDEIEKITEAADKLRCAYGEFAGGSWNNNPIWQKQAGKGRKKQDAVGDGCEVHQSLARHLYEKRDPERDSPPPKKRGNNVARGAAHALAEGKFQNAIDLLTGLQASIANSKVNPEFGKVLDPETGVDGDAEYWAMKLSYFAGIMAGQIHPETQSCD